MWVDEKRLSVLRLIEEGKLSADEGEAVWELVNGDEEEWDSAESHPRFLIIQIKPDKANQPLLQMRLPLTLIETALSMGAELWPNTPDFDDEKLFALQRARLRGKLATLQHPQSEQFELFLE